MKTGKGPTVSYTKNQHYVWRYYLGPWCMAGKLWCYRQKDKCLFRTTPKSIANETYFYEMHRLTPEDTSFLEAFINRASDQRLRDLNHDYLRFNQMSFDLRDQLQNANLPQEAKIALERELRIAEKTLGEHYHTGIENHARPILDALRNRDSSFYDDVKPCGDFLYFLCNQYFRTAKMRGAITMVLRPIPGHDPRRTGNVEAHLYATNVSVGLFRERQAYRIIFLINQTPTPFITGDQPVISLLDPLKTDDLELYYPLSPALGIVLSKDTEKFSNQSRNVTELEVERYNHAIYERSEDQIYSGDKVYLQQLVSIEKHLFA